MQSGRAKRPDRDHTADSESLYFSPRRNGSAVRRQYSLLYSFFKEDGSELDWLIKTVMSKSGYLLDVSLSPEGTQVMVSNVYLQDGIMGNRVAFYNFSEYGKSYPDRLEAVLRR